MTTPIKAKASTLNHIIALFVGLGSFTYGFNFVAVGSVIGLSSFLNYFNLVLTESYGAAIIGACTGLFTAGGFIGCWTVDWLSDRLGRRRTIQVLAAVCVLSAVLQTASVHIAMFLIGRFVNGIGCGMLNCTIPTYLSEISPPAQRGRLVGFHGVMTCLGYGSAGWAGLGTYFESNPQVQWRLFIGCQIVMPFLLFCGTPFIPESPRWLTTRDRNDEAFQTLKRLHNDPLNDSHSGARAEFEQIQQQIALERLEPESNLFKLLISRRYRKRLLLGTFLQIIDQSTGVLVISNYMVVELSNLNVTDYKPLLILSIYNTWAFFLNIVNALVVDRTGRVKTITFGISAGVICLTIVTGLVANYGTTDNTNKVGAGAAIAFMFLFVTSYGSCVDASSYIYTAEIFPTSVRARGVGLVTSAVFFMNTIYLTVAGTAFANIGWRFYIVFIVIPAVAVPIFLLYYPETKGLTLEEIGALFGDEVGSSAVQSSGQQVGLDNRPGSLDLSSNEKHRVASEPAVDQEEYVP